MYLAIYRKFRPKTFDEVVGQEHIVEALSNQIKANKISHAYLFTGARGTGKTSCAKIFAKAINCENTKNGSPCGDCDVCKALNENNNVDIFEIDAASNNGINEIRDLRDKIKYPPINGRYKVYIIDEVHMLTDSAFNALLKTLEEPPEHVVFILATTEVYKIPATILSRCMRFDFKLVSLDVLKSHLKKVFDALNVKYDDKSIELIALAGEGSVRDMLSVADCVVAYCGDNVEYMKTLEVLGISDRKQISNLISNIIDENLGEILTIINEVCNSGKNLVSFGKEISIYIKDLLICKSCVNPENILSTSSEDIVLLKKIADKTTTQKLIEYLKLFSKMEMDLKYAFSPRTLIEITALECASLENQKKN